MIRFTLSVGSNDGDRAQNVSKAIEWICDVFSDVKFSAVYETPEIHGKGTPYMNAVADASTRLCMDDVNALMKEYELNHGRNLHARAQGRVPIDIDIVIWDGDVIRPFDRSAEFFRIGYRQLNQY